MGILRRMHLEVNFALGSGRKGESSFWTQRNFSAEKMG